MVTNLHHDVHGMLLHMLQRPGHSIEQRLYEAMRLVCKYRTELLSERLLSSGGAVVRTGPFAGMRFAKATEGSFAPKLLGCYEQELQPLITSLPGRGYQQIINVGCAGGYYAVGLARLLDGVTVHAFDIDPKARQACAELAQVNGVSAQVVIGERLEASDFASFGDKRTLVLCDIEGAEMELFKPAEAPALARMDLLLEVHDDLVPGCSAAMERRFAATHEIERISLGGRDVRELKELTGLEHLDQLLAVWEWRLAGNAWMWLAAKG